MERLFEIQQELKVSKNHNNDFGGYKYRKAEDILEALKPLLKKHKCVLVLSDQIVALGERIFIEAKATLKDVAGKLISETSAYAEIDLNKKKMDRSQICGSASSYARKIAMSGLFALDDSDVSEQTTTEEQTTELVATANQLEIIKKYYTGDNFTKLLKANNLSKIEDMPLEKASEICTKIKEMEEQNGQSN